MLWSAPGMRFSIRVSDEDLINLFDGTHLNKGFFSSSRIPIEGFWDFVLVIKSNKIEVKSSPIWAKSKLAPWFVSLKSENGAKPASRFIKLFNLGSPPPAKFLLIAKILGEVFPFEILSIPVFPEARVKLAPCTSKIINMSLYHLQIYFFHLYKDSY